MKRGKTEPPIPIRRMLVIMEGAQSKRCHECQPHEIFDPVRYIEHTMPKHVKDFTFHYDEDDPVFRQAPTTKAYVDVRNGIILVMRESVYEAAYRGDPQSRFILSHEIGHVFLHRRSGKVLARHSLSSTERNKVNKKNELEASLFGGTLLVPPAGTGESRLELRE